MIRCKLQQCPYCKCGFCDMKILVIDENGMCTNIWNKGRQYKKWPHEKEPAKMQGLTMIDSDFTSVN